MGLENNGKFTVVKRDGQTYVTVVCREHGTGELLVGSNDGKTPSPQFFCEACGHKNPPIAPIGGWDTFEQMERDFAAAREEAN